MKPLMILISLVFLGISTVKAEERYFVITPKYNKSFYPIKAIDSRPLVKHVQSLSGVGNYSLIGFGQGFFEHKGKETKSLIILVQNGFWEMLKGQIEGEKGYVLSTELSNYFEDPKSINKKIEVIKDVLGKSEKYIIEKRLVTGTLKGLEGLKKMYGSKLIFKEKAGLSYNSEPVPVSILFEINNDKLTLDQIEQSIKEFDTLGYSFRIVQM